MPSPLPSRSRRSADGPQPAVRLPGRVAGPARRADPRRRPADPVRARCALPRLGRRRGRRDPRVRLAGPPGAADRHGARLGVLHRGTARCRAGYHVHRGQRLRQGAELRAHLPDDRRQVVGGSVSESRSNFLVRSIEWLRAGYPSGVPRQDYVALLGILRRNLTEDEVRGIARALATESDRSPDPITTEDIESMISGEVLQKATPED